MPGFKIIGLSVLKTLKGFYHIWEWQPSWSNEPDFTLPTEAPYEIRLIKIGLAVSEMIFGGQMAQLSLYTRVSKCKEITYPITSLEA